MSDRLTIDFSKGGGLVDEPTYTVQRIDETHYLVTKFADDGRPNNEYNVTLPYGTEDDRNIFCDCQGFRRQKYPKPEHKHIKLVKEHVRQGEPTGRVYSLDKDNNPVVEFEFDNTTFDPSD